jgi:predicted transglutaminase-like cysteine proteinase
LALWGLCLLGLCVGVSLAWDSARMLKAAQAWGDGTVGSVRSLMALMARQSSRDELASVREVNRFFNEHIAFREDSDNWAQVDYWASPMESLGHAAGDCEDYAIAKYVSLVALGVPHHKLRLVYAKANTAAGVVPHVVLAFYATPRAEPWVADNLQPELRLASQRPDLSPVFSFNAQQFWEGAGPQSLNQGSPQDRLTRWRAVLARAKEEGFL